jgi:hypothetical protein
MARPRTGPTFEREEERDVSRIDPKCSECYGRGWVHVTREQDEVWYDENPDRSRPSFYVVSDPCPLCNAAPAPRFRDWADLLRSSKFGGR